MAGVPPRSGLVQRVLAVSRASSFIRNMGYTRFRQRLAGKQRMPSVKNIEKPCAGKLHARFDEGGLAKACSLLYRLIERS